MFCGMINLAITGMKRKRRRSVLLFIILFLSFSVAIVSISTLSSISHTNAEYRLDVFGKWTLAIPAGIEEDRQFLESQAWAEDIGSSRYYGSILTKDGPVGVGTVDDSLIRLGRLSLIEGSWPTGADQIAIEGRHLSGYGVPDIGDSITITVSVPVGENYIAVEKTYVLCGILSEYTGLWNLTHNTQNIPLIGAVVSPGAGEDVLLTAQNAVPAAEIRSIPQYFVYAQEPDRETAFQLTREWMQESRDDYSACPCKNPNAYPQTDSQVPEAYYTYAIAVITMLAVLCSYIILLPGEIQSYCTLRGLGLTRGQMGIIMHTEALLLCVPAILLGIPFGMGLTWLILRLQVYTGSVPIQVYIPVDTLLAVGLLWIGMVVISRFFVFIMAAHAPILGRGQLQSRKHRFVRRFRSCLIVTMSILLGAVIIYTETESLEPRHRYQQLVNMPDYMIYAGSEPLSREDIALLRQVPGTKEVYGLNRQDIHIAYIKGMEDIPVTVYTLSLAQFEEALRLGGDASAFEQGELLVLCFPENSQETYRIPQGEIQLVVPGEPGGYLLEAAAVPVAVKRIPDNVLHRSVLFTQPYTLICSETFMEKFVGSLESGEQWGIYSGDGDFGYAEIDIMAASTAEDLSTDRSISAVCKKIGTQVNLMNDRELRQTQRQLYLQEIILLYSTELCIALVLLLIIGSTAALETEQEKYYFTVLRRLGMSSSQMKWKIVLKALGRGLIAMAGGWVVCCCYFLISALPSERPLSVVLSETVFTLEYCGFDTLYVICLSVFCVVLPVGCSLVAKRKVVKEVEML